MNEYDSVICALRHCASGARFPGQCNGCPLSFVRNEGLCINCIDGLLSKAADLLEQCIHPGNTDDEKRS